MSPPTIRTTHVGSLPRSDRLRSLLTDTADRDDAAFEEAVDESVREVVRRQAEVGIDVANDGEQSRIAYSVDVTNRLSGFGEGTVERAWPSDLDDFPEYAEELLGDTENIGGPVATGPIEYVGEDDLRRDLARFDEAVTAEGVEFPARFHTAPSPGAVLRFTETDYHDSDEAYLFDLAEALATEYEAIAETGAILQIDAPDLLAGFTLTYKDDSVDQFRERVRTHVDALNRAVAGIPDEQIRLHGCWGNYEGPHHHDVALDEVIGAFYEADVGGLVVEGANPRHQHEYRTFEEHPLPDGWRLIPGVIDVKTNVVEHPEVVAERIERFADAVGDPERVVAGADCGFETVVEGANAVHPAIAWKKLEALREGADLAAERLA
ncbi:cobalamin-independent methionine synthase II family protein [Halobellus limi]|uniref:5-methyltetrahydropteroyltriglutamate--homocysteine methyltransferase n=1 Tax=Halobellus limi TaxID=699433 RepID=A0A1H5ZMX7_9EURY|nr:cobalamin-independent methionine synthase II family protein [Halobellus limi]QCC48027.1 methionine synthase [Halobellus limi]SEG37562.1 5-methyltetrahydropteroyltriglutamate--homocysteine methyltransferase [Halobellus limi]